MIKFLSIIIPVYNEEKYIDRCISSLIKNEYPKDKLEIIFVDGMSNDSTREIISKYMKEYLYIKLIDNPKRTSPIAMNIGIKESKGELIMRMDAHSSYPSNYISKLVEWKEKLGADNVGAVCRTEVIHRNKKSMSIAKVLSNRFGVGNGLFRIGVNEPMIVDTVPFGLYDKSIFSKVGMYDERLTRNQDIELNKRILRNGGKIYLVPDINFIYYAREDYKAIFKNNYSNGLWNILTAYYTKNIKSLSIRHFIPLTFVLSILLPVLLFIINKKFIIISISSIVLYLMLVILVSINIKDNETSFFELVKSFFVLHWSYGLGSLVGIFKLFTIK